MSSLRGHNNPERVGALKHKSPATSPSVGPAVRFAQLVLRQIRKENLVDTAERTSEQSNEPTMGIQRLPAKKADGVKLRGYSPTTISAIEDFADGAKREDSEDSDEVATGDIPWFEADGGVGVDDSAEEESAGHRSDDEESLVKDFTDQQLTYLRNNVDRDAAEILIKKMWKMQGKATCQVELSTGETCGGYHHHIPHDEGLALEAKRKANAYAANNLAGKMTEQVEEEREAAAKTKKRDKRQQLKQNTASANPAKRQKTHDYEPDKVSKSKKRRKCDVCGNWHSGPCRTCGQCGHRHPGRPCSSGARTSASPQQATYASVAAKSAVAPRSLAQPDPVYCLAMMLQQAKTPEAQASAVRVGILMAAQQQLPPDLPAALNQGHVDAFMQLVQQATAPEDIDRIANLGALLGQSIAQQQLASTQPDPDVRRRPQQQQPARDAESSKKPKYGDSRKRTR